MIYRLSIWLTNWFIEHEVLKKADYDVYVYCIDSLLNKVLFYSIIITIASIFHILPETFWYYLGFIPFRYTAGGYHAKSEAACSVLSWAVYGLSMALVLNLCFMDMPTQIISMILVSLVTLIAWRYAPVAHINKPVAPAQKQKLRKVCLCFQGCYLWVTMLLIWQHYYNFAFSLALGNSIAAIFLVLAYYQGRDAHPKGGE